jgi:hypothetical protein
MSKQLSSSTIVLIIMYLLGLFAFIFLSNAFFGKITTHQGKVLRKFIHYNAEGKPFYRVTIVVDSKLVDIQSQPNQYKFIEAGDSITYYVRVGLFDNSIIEQYNAQVK